MTTAHRPTFDPVKGKKGFEGSISHSRQLPAHTKLKYRNVDGERDFTDELKIRELEASGNKEKTHALLLESIDEPETDLAEKREFSSDAGEHDEEDESDSDDEEDDDELLMQELMKIKRERAEKKEREEREAKEAALEQRKRDLGIDRLRSDAFDVKRDWTEQSLFSNQAKKQKVDDGANPTNDLLKSDYHKTFLDRFIR